MLPDPGPQPQPSIGRSLLRFTGVLLTGLVVLGGLALWFSGVTVVAGAVLLLLLPLGLDARLSGWLAACAALTGLIAVDATGRAAYVRAVTTAVLLLWALLVMVAALRRAGTLV